MASSTMMDRGMAQRLAEGDLLLSTLGRQIRTKDHNIDRITSLSQMTYTEGSDRQELPFFEPVNFNERLDDRRGYNLTWLERANEASRIGGIEKYREDYAKGKAAGTKAIEQMGNAMYQEVVESSDVDTSSTSVAFATSDNETTRDGKVEQLLIDVANELRGVSKGGDRNSYINIYVPFRISGILNRYLSTRETGQGDREIDGMMKSSFWRTKMMAPANSPITFDVKFSTNPVNGDTLSLVKGSRYATIHFVTALSNPTKPNEVQIGANPAATRARAFEFLTQQDEAKGKAGEYTNRVAYDVSFDPNDEDAKPSKWNLQQREIRFSKPEGTVTANTRLTVYGAPAGVEFNRTQATNAGIDGSVDDEKYVCLFTTDNGIVDWIIRDDMQYRSQPWQENMSFVRNQIWGTFGLGIRNDGAVKALKSNITFG